MSQFPQISKFAEDTKNTTTIQEEIKPTNNIYTEQTKANSSLYEPYDLRPYNPNELYQKRGNYDIYDEMREDEQIKAVLSLKKFLILGHKWEIETDNEEIKEFIEFNLHYLLEGSFQNALYQILSSLDYGFSITEKIFKNINHPKFGNKIILKNLKTRPPHTFEFDQDDKGNITKIRQDQALGSDINVNKKKVIHYTYQKEFSNPYGSSEFNLGVYRAWWSKNAIIKFYNIYLERFGMPTVVGTYPQTLAKEKNALNNALKGIQAKTAITIPEGITLDLLSKQGASGRSGYKEAIDMYDTMIARSMLVPDLLGYSGDETGGGSFALGQSQFEMFYNNIEQERNNLIRVINKEIIFPLTIWNFGKDAFAELKFQKVNEERKKEDLKIWLDAIKTSHIPVTDEHINWFLSQVNAPKIEEAELNKINEEKEKMKEQIQGGIDENKPDEDETKQNPTEKTKEIDKSNPKEKEDKKEKKFSRFFREFTSYEQKVDFTQVENNMTNIVDENVEKLGNTFTLMINALVNDIKTKKIVEKGKLDQINKLKIKHEDKLTRDMNKLYRQSLIAGKTSVKKEVAQKFAIEGDILSNEDVVKWINESSIYTASTEAQEILKKVKGTLGGAIRSGASLNDTMKMIDKELKGYDISLDANRIETIARTVTSSGFNEGRAQQYTSLGDAVQAYQFSAILDHYPDGTWRTSEICRSLDKKIFRKSELSYYNPPLHFNCRSLVVAVFTDEEFDGYSKMPGTEQTKGSFLELSK
jgi:SPP1 gp7 family putative phage head morphogenesis protein